TNLFDLQFEDRRGSHGDSKKAQSAGIRNGSHQLRQSNEAHSCGDERKVERILLSQSCLQHQSFLLLESCSRKSTPANAASVKSVFLFRITVLRRPEAS